MLRLNLVGGRSIDGIAERFGTHRSTAARWLAQSKQRVTEPTREELSARLVQSQLDLSIQRHL